MKRIAIATCLLCILLYSSSVFGATFDFDGYLDYHNDIATFSFTLDNDATNIRVWTDSYDNGANFDPITALWTASGDLISENDDNRNINPSTQTVFDSGFNLAALNAGDYLFTIASYYNFANGNSLSDGFRFDNDTPIPIDVWSGSGYYHVVFDGVDGAANTNTNPVPEPATMVLLGSGLLGLAGVSRKKHKK